MPRVSNSFRHIWPLLLLIVSTASATVHARVEIIAQPESKFGVPIASETEFSVIAVGKGELHYQWRLNGVNMNGATEATYKIPRVTPRDAGIYTVAVGDEDGYITSPQAQLSLLVPGMPENANDVFQKRFFIEIPNGILRADNSKATSEEGEPRHAGKRGGKSIWFQWTAPLAGGDGIVTFNTAGSAFDTLLAAYRGPGLDQLEELASNDDYYDSYLTSRIQFNAKAGETYYIAVDGFTGANGEALLAWDFEPTLDLLPHVTFVSPGGTAPPGGQVELHFQTDHGEGQWLRNGEPLEGAEELLVIEAAREEDVGSYAVRVRTQQGREVLTQPQRVQLHMRDDGTFDPESTTFTKLQDAAERAAQVWAKVQEPQLVRQAASSGPARGYSSTQVFSTYGSTKEPDEPNHCGEAGGASEWYAYQAPDAGILQINTDGSNFDTILAVYTGPGTDFQSMVLEACDNVAGNGGDRVSFSVQKDDIFWIAVDGVDGATGTVKLNMNVGAPVEILTHPASQTATVGSAVTFSVEATGSAELNYAWYFNNQKISGATAPTFTISTVGSFHAGTYKVQVSNLVNAVVSSPATLTVNTPPSISSHPVSQTVNEGESVSFSVTATGTAPLQYKWYRGTAEISGATGATFSLAAATSSDAGEYKVAVTNMAGTATSSPATLTVNTPPSVSSHPVSQTVNEGESVGFSVTATGTAPLQYKWYRGTTEISGATGATFALAAATSSDAGEYKVAVTNMAGTATSSPATLTVNTPPSISSQPLSRTVPPGGHSQLNLAATGTPAPGYQWFFNNAELPGMTDAVLTLSNFQAVNQGEYKVRATNSLGSVMSQTVRLALDWPPRIEAFVVDGNDFRLDFVGPADTHYRVEASENLVDWIPLWSQFSSSGFLRYTDSPGSGISFRFYRVVEVGE